MIKYLSKLSLESVENVVQVIIKPHEIKDSKFDFMRFILANDEFSFRHLVCFAYIINSFEFPDA